MEVRISDRWHFARQKWVAKLLAALVKIFASEFGVAKFSHLDLAGAKFSHLNLAGAKFSHLDLVGAKFLHLTFFPAKCFVFLYFGIPLYLIIKN